MSNLMILLATAMAGLQAPAALDTAWTFTAEGPVAAGMVVAEVHVQPGPETVFIDTGTGSVVCLGADGIVLWTHDGNFFTEEAAPLAATTQVRDRHALILVQDDDHTVLALDGTTGEEAWRFDVPDLGAARLHWADLDDDEQAEALILAPDYAIVALEADGRVLWEVFPDDLRGDGPLLPRLAVGDGTGDFFGETAGARGDTVFLLDNLGFPLWEEPLAGEVVAGPVMLGAGLDTPGAVIVATADTLVLLEPDTGLARWEAPLPGRPAAEGLAIAYLRAGGPEGIAVADEDGGLSLFDRDGAAVWTGELAAGTSVTLLAGDLAGSGWTDLIAVDPAGTLQVLEDGRAESVPVPAGPGALQAALTQLADADHAALIVNRGQEVQALTRHGRTYPALLPWAQAGGAAGRNNLHRRTRALDDLRWVEERVPLDVPGWPAGDNGPEAWETVDGAGDVRFDDGQLHLVPEGDDGALAVLGPPVALPPYTVELAFQPVGGAERHVLWEDWEGTALRTDEVGASTADPPYSAARFRIRLRATEAVALADPGFTALTRTLPRAGIFFNVLGYETNGAKQFTAWTNFIANNYRFHVRDSNGSNLYSGSLAYAERVESPEGKDWGAYYWRGDFTDLLEVGTFRLAVDFDGVTVQTPPFPVEIDRMWNALFPVVYGAFDAHRCSQENALPCEQPEGAPAGLWRRGTDPGTLDTARTVYRFADIFLMSRWRFEPDGQLNALGQRLQHDILEGARTLVAAREQLDDAGQEVFELYGAALAKAARTDDEADDALVEAARAAVDRALENEAPGPLAYGAAMDLFILTRDEAYEEAVKATYPGPNLIAPEGVVEYEIQIDEMSMTSMALMQFLNRESESLAAQAQNPFGVYLSADADGNAPETVDTAEILQAAAVVAQAIRFQPRAPFRAFVQSQLDWLLGNNPLGAVLIQGPGPELAWSLADGDTPWEGVPGLVVEALRFEGPGGLPCVQCADAPGDGTGLAYSLETSLHLLDTIAQLKRIRN